MKPNRLSKFIAPTAAALAVLAGAGEVADKTTGINLFPDTATSLGNYASEVNGACEAFPGTPGRPEGVTTIKMGFVVNDVLRGNTATTKDIRVVAGANGAQVDYTGDDKGPVYIAPGQTIISHTQALTTPAATGLNVWSRNAVRTSVTKEVVSVYALNPRVALPKGGFTQEDTFTAKYAEIEKLVCVPERHIPVTQDITPPPAEVKAPTNPETPAQGTPTPTPEVCPATEPGKIGFIDIPARVTEGKTFPGNWSVKNTGPLDLGKPDVKISLPSGLSVKAIPANMKLVRGNTLVLKKDILGTSWALDMNETKAGRIMLMANKVKVNTRATVRLRSEAKTVVVKANGQPCDSTATKARDSTVIINLPDVPVVGGFTG